MPIKLDEERKSKIVAALTDYYYSEFEEELSAFRAVELVDFMVQQIGPSQYNQGVSDARKYMAEKLDDLDVDLNEPERD